ncbi:BZIP-like protein [Trifolium pratense]|uniref:BZIP-like protein n=1 Tax=Trifolium pratense TaxID=57577 RepID=A0A2K3NYM6_TRIPR|nr:BZIP-like protein [Trifolium pratense]
MSLHHNSRSVESEDYNADKLTDVWIGRSLSLRVNQDKDEVEIILATPLVGSVREDKVVWEEGKKWVLFSEIRRRVECTLNCPVCDEEIENDLHVFFNCSIAHDSWCATGLSSVLNNNTYQQTTAMDRIFALCNNENSDNVGRVAMLLWCIWYNRNDKIWNDNVQMPSQIGRHVFDACWVKCNVDVAFVTGSGKTSVGLCFRDSNGQFMAGMT